MGRGAKGSCTHKQGTSHTSALINMLVQESKGELESWPGKECTCLCFQDGEMLHERLAYWHWELLSWHLTACTMFTGSFYPEKLQGDLLAPRIPDCGDRNTSECFWGKVSSTAFLLCPFLPCSFFLFCCCFPFFLCFLNFFAMSHGFQDLSSPTRDWTWSHVSEST